MADFLWTRSVLKSENWNRLNCSPNLFAFSSVFFSWLLFFGMWDYEKWVVEYCWDIVFEAGFCWFWEKAVNYGWPFLLGLGIDSNNSAAGMVTLANTLYFLCEEKSLYILIFITMVGIGPTFNINPSTKQLKHQMCDWANSHCVF